MTAPPRSIEQAEDDVLWWQAANLECPGIFREQLAAAQGRLRFLQRAARLAHLPARTLPQATIDQIMDLVTMPDIIPDLLSRLCGEALEWRPGAREGKLATCPFCGNTRHNFEMLLSGPKCGQWICRACNEGGSLKWFLLRRAGLGFRELMRELGHYAGVSIEDTSKPREQRWEPI